MISGSSSFFFFFFNDTATTEIYTLSLHDALPIFFDVDKARRRLDELNAQAEDPTLWNDQQRAQRVIRSEEHTSELQSLTNLVCRLLLEKKKKKTIYAVTQEIEQLSPIAKPRVENE